MKDWLVEMVIKRWIPSLVATGVALLMDHSAILASWGIAVNWDVFKGKAAALAVAGALFAAHWAMYWHEKLTAKPGAGK
jgi:hypothetical protein